MVTRSEDANNLSHRTIEPCMHDRLETLFHCDRVAQFVCVGVGTLDDVDGSCGRIRLLLLTCVRAATTATKTSGASRCDCIQKYSIKEEVVIDKTIVNTLKQ